MGASGVLPHSRGAHVVARAKIAPAPLRAAVRRGVAMVLCLSDWGGGRSLIKAAAAEHRTSPRVLQAAWAAWAACSRERLGIFCGDAAVAGSEYRASAGQRTAQGSTALCRLTCKRRPACRGHAGDHARAQAAEGRCTDAQLCMQLTHVASWGCNDEVATRVVGMLGPIALLPAAPLGDRAATARSLPALLWALLHGASSVCSRRRSSQRVGALCIS
eukprot:CAMPEP_0195145854 /NCGR_PEP_ID=MMETSP0448-20130528/170570_1 /TAXON_ID=66468 /ORGANISM="Heterocapsa triquestra, Strain CCMP 448" /LENGTH=216 /DNA_ID=CAMNT_0040184383 /DNA_START=212 /DNA_END=864 /DNA_ORIENTATION=-